MASPCKSRYIFVALLFLITIFLPANAHCTEDPIARLTDFSGTVLIKSLGEWAVKPEKNLPLYSRDKVVTRIGTATVTFSDGATVDIKNNSNLFIDERKTETGLTKKVKMVERRIILFLGKMFFKTGAGQVHTQFATEKTVIGIRGTAGIFSIGPDGQVYITFIEGRAKEIIGDVISGEAKALSLLEADLNPIQQASIKAYLAYQKCLEAKRKLERGEISPVQVLWACSRAKVRTAEEYIICAEQIIKYTPDPEMRETWQEIQEDEKKNLEIHIKVEEDALKRGAIEEPEVYQPPGEQFLPEREIIPETFLEIEDEGRNMSDPEAENPTAGNEEEIPIDDSKYGGSQVPK